MATIVQKFGGTSVGTIERIQLVAERAVRTHRKGNRVVVVVSAMAGETNRLVDLAGQLTRAPHHREIDVLLASGEQVSIGLVALAICEKGVEARSFLGHQVRITTDDAHGMARIMDIEAGSVVEALDAGQIVVIAGFQGINAAGQITTLGRGGSDLSAVAMAAAIGADSCEIYTDVDDIYTTDAEVFAPCAMGAVLNDSTVGRLTAKIVAGSANNQMAEDHHGDVLAARNVLYAPDYVINAGGIINISHERPVYDKAKAFDHTAEIYDTLLSLFGQADASRLPPYAMADRMAERRIQDAREARAEAA